MGVVLGLCAALAFGGADFCARFTARQIGNFRTLLYMQLVGGAALSLWLLLGKGPLNFNLPLMGITAILGVGNTFGCLALYRAFEIGTLSVVSPVAASYGTVSLTLGLITGQRPTFLQLLGLVVTIIGVILSSTPLFVNTTGGNSHIETREISKAGKFRPGNGIGMALAAALSFGVVFWGLGFVSPDLGGILPVWEIRLVGPPVVLGVAGMLKKSLALPQGLVWLLLVMIGLLDTFAFLCLNLGTSLSESSIVAVLSSLFSAFTILLARFFLNENLAFNQWVGIGLILLGIVFISVG